MRSVLRLMLISVPIAASSRSQGEVRYKLSTHVKRSITRMYVVTAKSIALTDTDEQRGLHSVYSGAHATDTRDNGMGSRQRLERGGSALSSMLPHAQMIR